MGRHSSSEQGPFYASVARWALPWVLAVGVVGAAVFIAADAFGPEDANPASDVQASPTPTKSSAPSPSPEPTRTKSPTPKPTKTKSSNELITRGISLQVLNASSDADADDRVGQRLTQLGFEVVSVEDSLSTESQTTVYWANAGAQEAARRLAKRMGWIAQAQPDSLQLTAEVDLHVIVGNDEAT